MLGEEPTDEDVGKVNGEIDCEDSVGGLTEPGGGCRLARQAADRSIAEIAALPWERQVSELNTAGLLREFALQKRTWTVMKLVRKLPREAQIDVLAAPHAVSWLIHGNQSRARLIVALLERIPPDSRTPILAAPSTVSALVRSGQSSAAFAMIDGLSARDKVTVLGTDYAIAALMRGGVVTPLVELISSLPRRALARLLTSGGVVSAIAEYRAELAIELVETLTSNERTAVLAGWCVVKHLAECGKATWVVAALEGLRPDQQAAVLAAPCAIRALGDAKQWRAVETLLRNAVIPRRPHTRPSLHSQSSPMS